MKTDLDVFLIGGGITGLMAAQKLSELGMQVALVERQPTLAAGPSTRNEGWLHRGTYHAASIKNRTDAIQVARRCINGHKQLRRFAPEAIEGMDLRPFALIRDDERAMEIVSRWDAAGVRYRPVTHAAASEVLAGASLSKSTVIFEVDDVSVNTRLVYRKLLAQARKAGCLFLIGYEIESIDGQSALVRNNDGQTLTVNAKKFVYSAGTGTKALFEKHHGTSLPIRYWKSHLVVTKRLAPVGVFYLDAHEAAMMHHGDVSIVGFNEDALLSSEPSYDVIPERADNLRRGIGRIFPKWGSSESFDMACVKVDFAPDPNGERSLNIAISEPVEGHVVVLPGKMTEAPYLTDILSSYLHHSLDNPDIALRPSDHFLSDTSTLRVA